MICCHQSDHGSIVTGFLYSNNYISLIAYIFLKSSETLENRMFVYTISHVHVIAF